MPLLIPTHNYTAVVLWLVSTNYSAVNVENRDQLFRSEGLYADPIDWGVIPVVKPDYRLHIANR